MSGRRLLIRGGRVIDPAAALDVVARFGVPIAAILMPAGFFLSVLGKDPVTPGRAFILLWIGATSLTLGLLACGIAALATGIGALP